MASRFWVGGTGNWDASTTTHWSATTGGGGGASVPGSSDDVTFDSNSGAAATVTITAAANANSITINKGDLTLLDNSGMTVVGAVNFTQGTLNTNGQTEVWGSISSSNSNTRTITMGASQITVSASGSSWQFATAGNLTVSVNTATVTQTGAGVTFQGGGKNWQGMSLVQNGSGATTIGSSTGNTLKNLSRLGTATTTDSISFSGNTNVSGTLTLIGGSVTNRLLVQSDTIGTPRTLQVAAVSNTTAYVDFADIAGTGAAAPFTGTSFGDCQGNSGITFDTPVTQTWQGTSGGNWSDNTKWTSRVPLPQDNVIINAAFSAAQTITADIPRLCANLTWTGVTGSPGWTFGQAISVFGNLTMNSGMGPITSGGFFLLLQGRGAQTLTCAGKSVPGGGAAVQVNAPGGTYTSQDNLIMGATFQLSAGTYSANNFNVQANAFQQTAGVGTRTLNMGTGIWTLTASSGNAWIGTNLTINASTSTIVLSNNGSGAKTFSGASATYNNLSITGGGTGAVTISGSNTFNTITVGAPKTLTLTSATTQTVNSFVALGNSGNVITINAVTPTSAATISQSAGLVSCDWLALTDSTATGGALFYAGNNSTGAAGQNNSGWLFRPPPARQSLSGMG